MKLEQLYIKPARNAPMVEVARATATAGFGLGGDCNASTSSPRQVLIVSAATVAQLKVAPEDLRANFVVNTDVDRLPSGTVVRVGVVQIRLTLSCEPCRKLEAVRKGLARETCGRRGMLGRIIAGGEVRVGDEISVEPMTLPGLEEKWQARVVDILGRLPKEKRVTFSRLAEVAGLQSTYCRAFPALLRRLADTNLPIDRVVSTTTERSMASKRSVQHKDASLWDGASYYLCSEPSAKM
jgi:MOSC domain-containing protein YiiM